MTNLLPPMHSDCHCYTVTATDDSWGCGFVRDAKREGFVSCVSICCAPPEVPCTRLRLERWAMTALMVKKVMMAAATRVPITMPAIAPPLSFLLFSGTAVVEMDAGLAISTSLGAMPKTVASGESAG